MKKGTLMLISTLAIVLFTLSYCKTSEKPLFYQENGNYFVDNNFMVKTTAAMSAEDVKQLISLEMDSNYARLTQGRAFILNTANILRILRTTQILHIQDVTRFERIQKILDIHRGCYELQQIDWAQFGDLKAKLDGILNKYNPVLVNGNISITNNHIATSAVELKAADIDQMDKLTIRGAEEYDICPDLGPNRVTHIVKVTHTMAPDKKLTSSLEKILKTYK